MISASATMDTKISGQIGQPAALMMSHMERSRSQIE